VDIQTAILDAKRCVYDGEDRDGNPKFRISGRSVDGRSLEIICSLLCDMSVLFVTTYEVH
jgi:hypothetical protein